MHLPVLGTGCGTRKTLQLARVISNCLSFLLARYVKESVMGEAKLAMAVDIRLPSDQASNRHCMHLALSAATSRDRAKTERANRSANQPLDTGHRRCLSLYHIHQLDGRCGNCRCKTGLVQSGTVLLIGVYQLVSRDAVSY